MEYKIAAIPTTEAASFTIRSITGAKWIPGRSIPVI
jgi:hypothetical protein